MSKKSKARSAATAAAVEDADFYKQQWVDEMKRQRLEWLRDQLVGWWARTLAEFEAVQSALSDENSELHAAFTRDERWEMDAALEAAWGEFSSLNKKPPCVPKFLQSMAAWIPARVTSEGVS